MYMFTPVCPIFISATTIIHTYKLLYGVEVYNNTLKCLFFYDFQWVFLLKIKKNQNLYQMSLNFVDNHIQEI